MREGSLTERRSGLQLVAQIKTLRRSQSTRNQSIKGSHTLLSPPPSTIRAASTESNRRHDRLLSSSGSQQSENSGLHRTPKAPVWRTSRRSSGTRFKDSAESETSRPSRIRLGPLRVTSRSTQLRGDRLGRESELTRSTQHYDDDFVPHRNSM